MARKKKAAKKRSLRAGKMAKRKDGSITRAAPSPRMGSGPWDEGYWRSDITEYSTGWRIAVSILSGIGWLVFLISWLFFYAGAYTLYQNAAISIISLLIVGAINAVAWIPWKR